MVVHKHAAMIKAKADNMDLVVLCEGNGKWIEVTCSFGEIAWWEDKMYFLCLPQHKETVLHGLNGGSYQVKCLADFSRNWYLDPKDWRDEDIWYMLESHESRIEPRKEKRWIIAKPNALVSMMYFESKESAQDAVNVSVGEFRGGQVIEIEVEV